MSSSIQKPFFVATGNTRFKTISGVDNSFGQASLVLAIGFSFALLEKCVIASSYLCSIFFDFLLQASDIECWWHAADSRTTDEQP